MVGRSVSHYKIVEKIGGGGMGQVYKAEDTKLNCYRALKFLSRDLLLDESSKKRFIREAQAASALDHPNICSVHEIDETDDGQLFISMGYYEGKSLKERIEKGRFNIREAFAIAFSVARGLSHAHARGVIHRDIKPANVMLTTDGYVKIVDFGLAKLMDRTRVTRSNVTVGTVAYMSPEQCTGEPVDARSDIWALGALLHEMLTAELPFRGEIDQAMIYSIINEPHRRVAEYRDDLPDECQAIISRCLEKDMSKRYQTADELITNLGKLAETLGWGSSISVGTVIPVSNALAVGRRRRTAFAVTAVVAAIAASVLTWWALTYEPGSDLYTTRVRVAVLPFENLIGARYDPLVDGLFESASGMAHQLARKHESAWVTDYNDVVKEPLPTPGDAFAALGVNRIIEGSVQRFANRHRLSLQLRDAESLETIRTSSVSFDVGGFANLPDSLPMALASLLDVPANVSFTKSADAAAAYLEGTGHLANDNLTDAAALFEQAIAADGQMARAHLGLGRVARLQLQAGGDDTLRSHAIRHLTRAAELDSTLAEPHAELSLLYQDLNDDEAAGQAASSAITRDPTSHWAPTVTGGLYRTQKRIDEAESVYRNSIAVNPDSWRLHRNLGLFFYRDGRIPEAIEALERTIALAPNNGRVLNDLGGLNHLLGQWTAAREYFNRSFLLAPDCANCSNVGAMLYYEGRFEDAASYFRFAFEYCDTNAYDTWGNWASALYWSKGEREKAIEVYRKAIERANRTVAEDPDDVYALAFLIDYYGMIGDSVGVHQAIARAQPFADMNADVMYRTANAYAMLNKRELALHHLGKALRHDYPLVEILNEPVFSDIIKDPIFQRMIEQQTAPDSAPAGTESR